MTEAINCPSCGAANQLPEGKTSMFCAFCGNSIHIQAPSPNTKKSNIVKAELVAFGLNGYKRLSYVKRNIESIETIVDLYSDSEIDLIKELELPNNSISTLAGIERFSLTKLNLSGNKISIIDELPKFSSERFYLDYFMSIEINLSNNITLNGFSDAAIYQIENPGYNQIVKFALILDGCPTFNLEQLSKINFSKYYRANDTSSIEAEIFIVIDSTLDFPNELKQQGFVKSNNVFFMKYKNVWEYKNANKPKASVTGNKSSGGKCFIATATMGSYDHPTVLELRNFRDNWIMQKSWGKSFVNWYYHYGAIAAKTIEKNFVLKTICYLLVVKPLYILSKIITQNK